MRYQKVGTPSKVRGGMWLKELSLVRYGQQGMYVWLMVLIKKEGRNEVWSLSKWYLLQLQCCESVSNPPFGSITLQNTDVNRARNVIRIRKQ